MVYNMYGLLGLKFFTTSCLSARVLRKKITKIFNTKEFHILYILWKEIWCRLKVAKWVLFKKCYFFSYSLKFTNVSHQKIIFSQKNNRSFWRIFLRKYISATYTCLIIILNRCKAICSRFWEKIYISLIGTSKVTFLALWTKI